MFTRVYSALEPELDLITEFMKDAVIPNMRVIAVAACFILLVIFIMRSLKRKRALLLLVGGAALAGGYIAFVEGGFTCVAGWAGEVKYWAGRTHRTVLRTLNDTIVTTASTAAGRSLGTASRPPRAGIGRAIPLAVLYAPDAERWRDIPETKSTIRVLYAPD